MSKESSELDHQLQMEFAETKEKQMTAEEVWRFEWQEQTLGGSLPCPALEQNGAEVMSIAVLAGERPSPPPHHPVAQTRPPSHRECQRAPAAAGVAEGSRAQRSNLEIISACLKAASVLRAQLHAGARQLGSDRHRTARLVLVSSCRGMRRSTRRTPPLPLEHPPLRLEQCKGSSEGRSPSSTSPVPVLTAGGRVGAPQNGCAHNMPVPTSFLPSPLLLRRFLPLSFSSPSKT